MIERVFTATINYDHPQRGMHHAFDALFPRTQHFDFLEMERQGANPNGITERFVEEVCAFQPDWLWLQAQNNGIIQSTGLLQIQKRVPHCVLSHWMGDCRATVSDYLSSICRATHLSFIAAAGQSELFKSAGAPEVHYLQIGIDWHEDYLEERGWVPPFRVPRVVMIGNHYGAAFPGTPQREAAMLALRDAGFDYGIVGSGWPSQFNKVGVCHVKDQVAVWQRADVGVSISHFNDIPLYYSDRQLISMLSGTPIVCRRVPWLEKEFQDGEHCVFFDDPGELVRSVLWLLEHPEERRRIGDAGRAEILRNHTWFARLLQVLPIIERVQRQLAQ